MPLESATYINGLNASNPTGADTKAEGDDHIRLLKSTVKATFPNLTGAVTADQNELNILDGATLSTAELNILDGVTATAAELNLLDGVTATTTEINYIDGVTSPIQTQLAGKADITGETYTGTHDFSGATAVKAPTKAPGSSGTDVATIDYANALAFSSALPALTGNALKTLRVNAGETSAEWVLGLPTATGNEGKTLALDGSAAPAWVEPPDDWANWTLITNNSGTFTVPAGRSKIRAYVFGAGGNGATATFGGGGGGGGCTYGTIPCKPGDVFTFDNTSGAVLKKGATSYLSANNGSTGSGSTGGAGGTAGTVGGGLGITSSGAYAGGAGGNGDGASMGGAGGSSGSPLGTGNAGASTTASGGGGGWGCAGNQHGGGGVGSQVATQQTLSGPYAINSEAASRDWSNAFTDPLLSPCNFGAPVSNFNRYAATTINALNAPPGSGGGKTNTGGAAGGSGGLGGGGGGGTSSFNAGNGGFGGGGGVQAASQTSGSAGNGGVGGGGGGKSGAGSSAGTGGSAGVIIFW